VKCSVNRRDDALVWLSGAHLHVHTAARPIDAIGHSHDTIVECMGKVNWEKYLKVMAAQTNLTPGRNGTVTSGAYILKIVGTDDD